MQHLKIKKALIFSVSLSTINSISNTNQHNVISRIIQNQNSLLNHNNQNMTLLCILTHVEIPSNEAADTYAKRVINSSEAYLVQICSLSDIATVATRLDIVANKTERNRTFYQPLANTLH